MRTRCLSIRILAGVAVVALCTACVGPGNTGSQPVDAMPPPTVSSSRVELIIRNAKQEVVNLRADLGAARITAAKKEVEVGEMRREIGHIRQRISELQETAAQQHYTAEQQLVELTAVKAASDRVSREKLEMQRELVEMQSLRDALAASRMADGQAQVRVKELENMLVAINEELATAKAESEKRLSQRRLSREEVSVGKMSKGPDVGAAFAANGVKEGRSIAAMKKTSETDAAAFLAGTFMAEPEWTVVTVKPGDTLGDLASAYGATIKQIREGNGLTGDVIRSGQRLRIPSPHQK